MTNLHFSAGDWRKQIRSNTHRTFGVIAVFILIYLSLGLLVDTYLHSGQFNTQYGVVYISPSAAFKALLTLQIIPFATIITTGIALISVLITFSLHNRLMLLGTDYREITPESFISLEEKQLYNVVEEMKTAGSFKYMPKVFIIEANYMNAFASGFSEKSAMVAITRGLMQKLNRSELQAVMAHELSHIRHQDIKLTLFASVLTNLMLIVIDIIFYSAFFSRDRERDNGLVMVIILLRFLLPVATALLMLYLSRTREYMADAGCVELMRDNAPLANALLKIHSDHRRYAVAYSREYGQTAHENVRSASYIFDPSQAGIASIKSISNMFSTHPSLEQRLQALGIDYHEES